MHFIISLSALVALATCAPIQQTIQNLKDTPATRYSSDFTRDIFVKKIHSHNDYWRDVPLYDALSYGVQSVEADVWYFGNGDDTLYVGHHDAALGPARTFASLYINPLVEILTQANPVNEFTSGQKSPYGVFDTSSSDTLYLFVDLKTDGNTTWPIVEKALEPLREKGWLTEFNGTDIVTGPVTVIGTGNTPYEYVSSQTTRDYFYDGPLATLNDSYPATLNPIASASLSNVVGIKDKNEIGIDGLNEEQYAKLNSTIQTAHSQGCLTRIWDVDWWPVARRDALWRQIIASGSDFLNADDLELASTFV
ncbi:Altered inheritance of mitochondria protein 6 [Cyberlindnera fabianii]|uniref:Altered inheritance of mitochondria protein 6 n=1 Tax=Cyberlindnera fabianii TaxID=36022 RepID=A0A1V2L8C2_CYBFA|nr:Altered inheritance of mitochondria protein 6 [Cyberlindnera fabianii]